MKLRLTFQELTLAAWQGGDWMLWAQSGRESSRPPAHDVHDRAGRGPALKSRSVGVAVDSSLVTFSVDSLK